MTLKLSIGQSEIQKSWPFLNNKNANTKSECDPFYNCLAFVVGDKDNKWWPVKVKNLGYYWPEGFPREESLDNFKKMLHDKFGYEECNEGGLEDGYEKIAIYCVRGNVPRHFAKQLPSGKWKSKLGQLEDIHHKLGALNGSLYGVPTVYLRRLKKKKKKN